MPNAAYLHAYLSRLAAAATGRGRRPRCCGSTSTASRCCARRSGSRSCDEVLRIAARRIQQALRAGDFAAYLGQDDFVVVAGDLDDGNGAATIAARVQAALAKPFSIRGGARRLTCSIGVTLLSDDRPDADRALANAEIALAEAQGGGAGQRPLLPRRPAPRGRAARDAVRRAHARARRRRGAALLPAADRDRDRPLLRLRGAGALAASRARAAGARGVPRLRRADRPHRADRRAGADPRARGAGRLGRGRASPCRGSASTSRSPSSATRG